MLTNKQCFGFAGLPSSQNKKSEKISKEFLVKFYLLIFESYFLYRITSKPYLTNWSSRPLTFQVFLFISWVNKKKTHTWVLLNTFLGPLVKENSFLPYDYFSSFELNRLHFTNFGKTKFPKHLIFLLNDFRDMNAQRGKLLLGGIIIIRALIYLIIMRPWDAFGQPKSKFKEEYFSPWFILLTFI